MTVVGGGLAGCEAAWQLASAGVRRRAPRIQAGGACRRRTPRRCWRRSSARNSLRSDAPDAPAGLLKAELRRAGSLIIACADATRVPAGEALAVDRVAFSRLVTTRLANHPRVRIERRVVDDLPDAGPCHPGHRPADRRRAWPACWAACAASRCTSTTPSPPSSTPRPSTPPSPSAPRAGASGAEDGRPRGPRGRRLPQLPARPPTNTRPSSRRCAPGARCCPTPSSRPSTSRAACPSR